MAKVFSWDEVSQGSVPSLGSFPIVVDLVREKLANNGGVLGGVICGSVLRGEHGIRSDFDCVVIYDPHNQEEVKETLWEVGISAARLFVPIEFIPVDLRIAGTSLQSIGPAFAEHLEFATLHGGTIKRSPLEFIDTSQQNPLEDAKSYVRHRIRALEKNLAELPVMTKEQYHAFLERIFQAPLHIARTVLWLHDINLPNDSQKEVIQHYPDVAKDQELVLFSELVDADRAYTEELRRQLGHLDEHSYLTALENIASLARTSLEFARLNALLVQERFPSSFSS